MCDKVARLAECTKEGDIEVKDLVRERDDLADKVKDLE